MNFIHAALPDGASALLLPVLAHAQIGFDAASQASSPAGQPASTFRAAGAAVTGRKRGVSAVAGPAGNTVNCSGTAFAQTAKLPSAGYVERRITAVLSKCKDPTAAAPRCACG